MADEPTTHGEQVPLLSPDGAQNAVRRTPLPLKQISIVLLLSFCDSVPIYVVFPFLNELLLSFTGGDETKVPYYASIMEACRTISLLIMIIYWGRISDYFGRKPILLLSCVSITSSMLLLGMSKAFWMVVLSRCILGGLNSIMAIGKTVIGELTDNTNRADAFALLNMPWSLGMSIGPLVGGSLSNPHMRYPHIFPGKIWRDFPYLLPCATIALTSSIAFLVALVHFRETLPRKRSSPTSVEETSTAARSRHSTPFHTLLTPRILLSISNYVVLSFLTMSYLAIQPLFFAMPISIGGLALEPVQIGSILGFFGFCNAFVQALLLGPAVRRFGLRRILEYSIFASIPMLLLFPLTNTYAADWQIHHHSSSRVIMFTLLVIQSVLFAIHDLGYGCMFIYITSSVPNKHSLGSVNGFGQMAASVARLTGLAFANTMLGLSIEKGWMGGYAVYFMLSCVAAGGVLLVGMLPKSAWETGGLEEG
ncbi:MFS general substrate transporter [Macrolepiota fuliginosa MF-IS2]|uniref:MFS general substrate transporter n=1 Tax=Macrolepiota fuliginosa MF-IS2 TaxID=1400762 RepID=A0A9P5XNJ8_9AGAR|nr:MFS general substrate transporter [Macrolepiota fuliginosa MF-IS2]